MSNRTAGKWHWRNLPYLLAYALARLGAWVQMAVLAVALCLPLVASRHPSILEQVQESGELVVLSRNGPTTYYEDSTGLTGFEYHLAKAFADQLGVKLVIKEVEDLGLMLNELGSSAHLAAAGLAITPRRQQRTAFTLPYMQVTQQLIYHIDSPRPNDVKDLAGKTIVVVGASTHAERLQQLQKVHPELTWLERHDVETLDLLEMVHNQKIDYAVVHSNAFRLNNTLYPKAQVAFDISAPEPLAWALPATADQSLVNAANRFLAQAQSEGLIAELQERFYGHLGEMGYADALVFTHRMQSRLPKWRDLLLEAAEETGVDWLLLAALSYQESHWNPQAVSPTGVRGFMMLTLNTAKEMGVRNRVDVRQSISGGSRYFRKLLDRIPESVTGQDRVWLALAAYNIGYGHLDDARRLAQQHGANPDKWAELKDYLPLLAKRQYYKSTRHGYARGHEAVTYVQNIRNFYTVLAWNEQEQGRLAQLKKNKNKTRPEVSEFSVLLSQLAADEPSGKDAL